MHNSLKVGVVLLGLFVSVSGLYGQSRTEWDGGRLELTREGLQQLLVRYEQTAASPAYSSDLRASALQEAEAIRLRLETGDFRTGDEITLNVEGEEGLNGVFLVNNNRRLALPVIGEIQLDGVLRSELQEHLRRQLSTYLVDPVVTAHSSIRLMISGSVSQPGIFVVPTNQLLSTALMDAGGPVATANLREIRIERGREVLWEGEDLQGAIAQGLTVDQLSLRSGDHIIIPEVQSATGLGQLVTTILPAVLIVVTSITQLF